MPTNRRDRYAPRSWRAFSRRDGERLEWSVRSGGHLGCPLCGEVLEVEPASRVNAHLVFGATAHDFSCRDCRRFWSVVRHTPRSLRLMRMRRFVAAVRSIEVEQAVPTANTAGFA